MRTEEHQWAWAATWAINLYTAIFTVLLGLVLLQRVTASEDIREDLSWLIWHRPPHSLSDRHELSLVNQDNSDSDINAKSWSKAGGEHCVIEPINIAVFNYRKTCPLCFLVHQNRTVKSILLLWLLSSFWIKCTSLNVWGTALWEPCKSHHILREYISIYKLPNSVADLYTALTLTSLGV